MRFYALYRLNTLVRRGSHRFENLPRVYCIGVLGTTLFPQIASYHNVAVLRNEEGVALDDQLVLITVELPKFDKPAAACVTDLDKLIFTMQNAHKITDLSLFPKFWDEHWIRIALEEVDTRAMNPEQLLQFEMQLSANAIAVKHAQRALDEAKAAASIQGREEGREEVQAKNIRRLLLKGKNLSEIKGVSK